MFLYHTTVRSALRAVALRAKSSPLVAVIQAPVEKAEQIAERQLERYPTIGVQDQTRTHLRKVKMPAVQMVIMPPQKGEVTMILMTNVVPPESRENWRLGIDLDEPLRWRNYRLARGEESEVTWRLSEQAIGYYRQRLARLVTGRGGIPKPGQKPYLLPDVTAYEQVMKLVDHLHHYPGFSGIRSDVFDLGRYSSQLWKSTRPKFPYPKWPDMPYLQFNKREMAPLSTITTLSNQEEMTDEPAEQEEEGTLENDRGTGVI